MANHLSHQTMLAYLDGELSGRESAKTVEHIQSCWACRIEMERLEQDIALVLDAHANAFVPGLPHPPKSWVGFDLLVSQKIATTPPSVWTRLLAFVASVRTPVSAVACAALAAVLLLFSYLKFSPRPVSAKEALHSVDTTDTLKDSVTDGRVIRQRVRVRRTSSRDGSVTSDSLEAWKSSKAVVWETAATQGVGDALESECKLHGISAEMPLSASEFEAWGREIGGGPSLYSDGAALNLSFRRSVEGSLEEPSKVTLRVQPSTWRVEQMSLEFTDVSYEITEEDFAVVTADSLPPTLLASLQLGSNNLGRSSQLLPPSPILAKPLVPALDLDRVQLNVLMSLHALHADLGEPITVSRLDQKVAVGIWQLDPDRQKEIRTVLKDEPGIELEVRAPTSPSPSIVAVQRASTPAISVLTVSPHQQDPRVTKFFHDDEQEQAFITDALGQSTTVLAHLYALRNLQAEFPPERERALSPTEQAQLATLIRDHAKAAAGSLRDLTLRLDPLDAALNISSGTTVEPRFSGDTWQDESLDALGTARNADHLLRGLLTSGETASSPISTLSEIKLDLATLSAEMSQLEKR